MRGWHRAAAAFDRADFARGSYDLVFVTSASERHAKSNNNSTIDETLSAFDDIAAASRAAGISLRATIACAFVSPWPDEVIAADRVASIAARFAGGGVRTITLADTVGRADPFVVARQISETRSAAPAATLGLHLHDSLGYGIANVHAGLQLGIRTFEGALAGLGGCPFAPGAPGNQDIVALAEFVEACGFTTNVDKAALIEASDCIRRILENTAIFQGDRDLATSS
jgi:hydroxymethylglutaryl-CoA lyase